MGWVIIVRICYDKDAKKHTGVPTGTVTKETTKRFALRGLRLIGTGLYQGYFGTKQEAWLAVSRIAARQFPQAVPPVDLDHSIVTVYKTDPQPSPPAPRRKPSPLSVAKRELKAAESEATAAKEELEAAEAAFVAADEARKEARQRVKELEREAEEKRRAREAAKKQAQGTTAPARRKRGGTTSH